MSLPSDPSLQAFNQPQEGAKKASPPRPYRYTVPLWLLLALQVTVIIAVFTAMTAVWSVKMDRSIEEEVVNRLNSHMSYVNQALLHPFQSGHDAAENLVTLIMGNKESFRPKEDLNRLDMRPIYADDYVYDNGTAELYTADHLSLMDEEAFLRLAGIFAASSKYIHSISMATSSRQMLSPDDGLSQINMLTTEKKNKLLSVAYSAASSSASPSSTNDDEHNGMFDYKVWNNTLYESALPMGKISADIIAAAASSNTSSSININNTNSSGALHIPVFARPSGFLHTVDGDELVADRLADEDVGRSRQWVAYPRVASVPSVSTLNVDSTSASQAAPAVFTYAAYTVIIEGKAGISNALLSSEKKVKESIEAITGDLSGVLRYFTRPPPDNIGNDKDSYVVQPPLTLPPAAVSPWPERFPNTWMLVTLVDLTTVITPLLKTMTSGPDSYASLYDVSDEDESRHRLMATSDTSFAIVKIGGGGGNKHSNGDDGAYHFYRPRESPSMRLNEWYTIAHDLTEAQRRSAPPGTVIVPSGTIRRDGRFLSFVHIMLGHDHNHGPAHDGEGGGGGNNNSSNNSSGVEEPHHVHRVLDLLAVVSTNDDHYFGDMRSLRGGMIAFGVLAAIIVVALCIGIMLSIRAPLNTILRNLEHSSKLQNHLVDTQGMMTSPLTEVSDLCRSYLRVHEILLAAKSFLPASMLARFAAGDSSTDDDDEEDEDDEEESRNNNRNNNNDYDFIDEDGGGGVGGGDDDDMMDGGYWWDEDDDGDEDGGGELLGGTRRPLAPGETSSMASNRRRSSVSSQNNMQILAAFNSGLIAKKKAAAVPASAADQQRTANVSPRSGGIAGNAMSSASPSAVDSSSAALSLLKTRRVAILCINVKGFTTVPDFGAYTLSGHASQLTDVISRIATAERGVIDSFHGDHFVVSFNAVKAAASPAKKATLCAMAVANALEGTPFACLSMGASSGSAIVGALGDSTQRRLSIVGTCYTRALKLQRASADVEKSVAGLFGAAANTSSANSKGGGKGATTTTKVASPSPSSAAVGANCFCCLVDHSTMLECFDVHSSGVYSVAGRGGGGATGANAPIRAVLLGSTSSAANNTNIIQRQLNFMRSRNNERGVTFYNSPNPLFAASSAPSNANLNTQFGIAPQMSQVWGGDANGGGGGFAGADYSLNHRPSQFFGQSSVFRSSSSMQIGVGPQFGGNSQQQQQQQYQNQQHPTFGASVSGFYAAPSVTSFATVAGGSVNIQQQPSAYSSPMGLARQQQQQQRGFGFNHPASGGGPSSQQQQQGQGARAAAPMESVSTLDAYLYPAEYNAVDEGIGNTAHGEGHDTPFSADATTPSSTSASNGVPRAGGVAGSSHRPGTTSSSAHNGGALPSANGLIQTNPNNVTLLSQGDSSHSHMNLHLGAAAAHNNFISHGDNSAEDSGSHTTATTATTAGGDHYTSAPNAAVGGGAGEGLGAHTASNLSSTHQQRRAMAMVVLGGAQQPYGPTAAVNFANTKAPPAPASGSNSNNTSPAQRAQQQRHSNVVISAVGSADHLPLPLMNASAAMNTTLPGAAIEFNPAANRAFALVTSDEDEADESGHNRTVSTSGGGGGAVAEDAPNNNFLMINPAAGNGKSRNSSYHSQNPSPAALNGSDRPNYPISPNFNSSTTTAAAGAPTTIVGTGTNTGTPASSTAAAGGFGGGPMSLVGSTNTPPRPSVVGYTPTHLSFSQMATGAGHHPQYPQQQQHPNANGTPTPGGVSFSVANMMMQMAPTSGGGSSGTAGVGFAPRSNGVVVGSHFGSLFVPATESPGNATAAVVNTGMVRKPRGGGGANGKSARSGAVAATSASSTVSTLASRIITNHLVYAVFIGTARDGNGANGAGGGSGKAGNGIGGGGDDFTYADEWMYELRDKTQDDDGFAPKPAANITDDGGNGNNAPPSATAAVKAENAVTNNKNVGRGGGGRNGDSSNSNNNPLSCVSEATERMLKGDFMGALDAAKRRLAALELLSAATAASATANTTRTHSPTHIGGGGGEDNNNNNTKQYARSNKSVGSASSVAFGDTPKPTATDEAVGDDDDDEGDIVEVASGYFSSPENDNKGGESGAKYQQQKLQNTTTSKPITSAAINIITNAAKLSRSARSMRSIGSVSDNATTTTTTTTSTLNNNNNNNNNNANGGATAIGGANVGATVKSLEEEVLRYFIAVIGGLTPSQNLNVTAVAGPADRSTAITTAAFSPAPAPPPHPPADGVVVFNNGSMSQSPWPEQQQYYQTSTTAVAAGGAFALRLQQQQQQQQQHPNGIIDEMSSSSASVGNSNHGSSSNNAASPTTVVPPASSGGMGASFAGLSGVFPTTRGGGTTLPSVSSPVSSGPAAFHSFPPANSNSGGGSAAAVVVNAGRNYYGNAPAAVSMVPSSSVASSAYPSPNKLDTSVSTHTSNLAHSALIHGNIGGEGPLSTTVTDQQQQQQQQLQQYATPLPLSQQGASAMLSVPAVIRPKDVRVPIPPHILLALNALHPQSQNSSTSGGRKKQSSSSSSAGGQTVPASLLWCCVDDSTVARRTKEETSGGPAADYRPSAFANRRSAANAFPLKLTTVPLIPSNASTQQQQQQQTTTTPPPPPTNILPTSEQLLVLLELAAWVRLLYCCELCDITNIGAEEVYEAQLTQTVAAARAKLSSPSAPSATTAVSIPATLLADEAVLSAMFFRRVARARNLGAIMALF